MYFISVSNKTLKPSVNVLDMKSKTTLLFVFFFTTLANNSMQAQSIIVADSTSTISTNTAAFKSEKPVLPTPVWDKRSLVISVFNEAIVPSFLNVFDAPAHPGISVGVQHLLTKPMQNEWIWAYNLAFYHHLLLQNGLSLNTELAFRRNFSRMYAQTSLGVGYLHTFFPGKIYKLKNGSYNEVNDSGRGHFMPSFSIRPGYYPKKGDKSLSFFFQYQIFIETSFSPENDIPFLPHATFNLGANIPFNF